MSLGTLYVVSAPSGAGKTSLLKKVRERLPDLAVAVSHTTREARPGEVNGEHYHFVSKSTFADMVKNQEFLESAEVFGNSYGTSKQAVNSLLEKSIDVVLEIDWQGARQVKDIYPDAVSIFIMPPSIDELENRLRTRGQDSEEIISDRMQSARDELSHYPEYEYLVINNEFDQAVAELITLLTSPENAIRPGEDQLTRIISDH